MTDTLRDRIVQVQAEHVEGQLTNYDAAGREECGCGHQGNATYREHLADAILAIPGIAVVELPEPDEGLGQPNYVAMPGTVFVELGPGEPIPLSPGVARVVAAALLAAADRVERDQ